jgi:hypothetical protein
MVFQFLTVFIEVFQCCLFVIVLIHKGTLLYIAARYKTVQ